jgi:hypothetical protein
MPDQKVDLTKPLPRGAIPTPRSELAAAVPHIPDPSIAVPPSFLMWPIGLSSWNNYIYGDCVSAEEAFAKATAGPPPTGAPVMIPLATVVAWAQTNGYLNGASLTGVMKSMQSSGYMFNGKTYNDGPYNSVDWTNAATLQSAIYTNGPVKIGVGAGDFQSNANGVVTPGTSGWTMYNYPANLGEDHCVSLCGFGTLAELVALFKQHNVTVSVTSGMPTGLCYAVFSWNSIGIIDQQSMLNMTYEAWIRTPVTVIVSGPWNLQQINLSGLTAGPAAESNPNSFIYNSQSHVLYRDASGKVWDSWYDGSTSKWNLQQINLSGLTSGPAAVGDPDSFIYNNQSHVLYLDASGKVWDSWYEGATSKWNLQQINLGALTTGPQAMGDPDSFIYNNQSHVLYRDLSCRVWDSWYDGATSKWNLQQINAGGLTAGPAAESNINSFIYNNESHVLYRDATGRIWDSWYDGATSKWNLQQINVSGLTAGPAAVGDPASFIYNNQSHVLYVDSGGNVWDSWYDGATSKWNLQQINQSGLTVGPAAVGDPAAFIYNNQSHVLYRDSAGEVWDSWYDGASGHWNLQQINLGGITAGPAAVGNPGSFIYNNQSHVLYRDSSGKVWDSWY